MISKLDVSIKPISAYFKQVSDTDQLIAHHNAVRSCFGDIPYFFLKA
jgi:hypothetical protein